MLLMVIRCMTVAPLVILLVIGGLVALTVVIAAQYWRSIRRVAAEVGWWRALVVAVGNLVLVVGVFVLTTGVGAISIRATGWAGTLLGLPGPLRVGLVAVTAFIGITVVVLIIALAYNQLFPQIVRAFN